MYKISTLCGLFTFYSFKTGIGKHIKIEMIQKFMECLMLYNKLLQNFAVSNNKYLLLYIISDIKESESSSVVWF